MRFASWYGGLALLLIPVLLLFYRRAFRRWAALVSGPFGRLITGSEPAPSHVRRWWRRPVLLLAAVGLLALALMQPQWPGTGEDGRQRGRDIVVALDLSLSMLAEDAPANRLAQAKALARALALDVGGEGGHRLALLTFAGRAEVLCPMTTDYALFLDRLDAATVDDVALPGSAIAAVAEVPALLADLDPAFTDIIVLSDGEATDGEALAAARLLGTRGFTLHTVGIGRTDRASIVPVVQRDGSTAPLTFRGQTVRSRMREGVLAAMADATGGGYIAAADGSSALQTLYRERLATAPQRERRAGRGDTHRHVYQVVLAMALLLIALETVGHRRLDGVGR